MKIVDLIDGQIQITPEALSISPFSELWQKDTSKTKINATNQIKYIWFYCDFNSPYYQHPESDRHNLILMDVIKNKDFKVTPEIKEGLKKYKELHNTPAMKMLDAAHALVEKMEKYFKDVNLEEVDVKKVTDVFINMPKIIASLNEAKKNAQAEQTKGVKTRGDAELGMFEAGY